MTIVAFVIGLFHLLNVSGLFVLSTRDVRVFHLMMVLVLIFLTRASLKRLEQSVWDRWLRVGFAAVSVASCLYIM
ncbi:MAG: hypothetical protein HKN18_00740, partial [Silicimonas sp.]|nr:hypothetical protein [Silicimonas sp.]